MVGTFLILVVLDEGTRDASSLEVLAGMLLATVQAIALHWRRSKPERVTVAVLVTGLGLQLLLPTILVPFAALFAVGSLAAARPPGRHFFTTTVDDSAFTMALVVGAWALGEAVRSLRVAVPRSARPSRCWPGS